MHLVVVYMFYIYIYVLFYGVPEYELSLAISLATNSTNINAHRDTQIFHTNLNNLCQMKRCINHEMLHLT